MEAIVGGSTLGQPPSVGRGLAAQLLRRAQAELDDADLQGLTPDGFLHAHLAAIRAAAAVVALDGQVSARRRPRPVWDQLEQVDPRWQAWAAGFAAAAPMRAGIESGRIRDVEPALVEAAVASAQRFVAEVAVYLQTRDASQHTALAS